MFYPGVRRVNTTPWTSRPKLSPFRVRSLEASARRSKRRASVPPVLEPRPNGLADRFSQRFGPENPVRVFIVALLAGYALLVTAMVFLGLVLIHVLLPIGGLQEADERLQPVARRQSHARRRRTSRGSDRRSPEGT